MNELEWMVTARSKTASHLFPLISTARALKIREEFIFKIIVRHPFRKISNNQFVNMTPAS